MNALDPCRNCATPAELAALPLAPFEIEPAAGYPLAQKTKANEVVRIVSTIEVSPRRANGRGRAHHLPRGDEMAKPTEAEKFWAKVDRSGGPDACWPWLGYVRNGYGLARYGRSSIQAHRFAWIDQRGPIPEGLWVDHLCHNRDESCTLAKQCPHRRCVNPAHLEPVTPAVNNHRGRKSRGNGDGSPPLICPHGHNLTGRNLHIKSSGRWVCRACRNVDQRRYVEKRRSL